MSKLKICACFGCCAITETVQGLYSAGTSSPSIDWRDLALLLCAAVVILAAKKIILTVLLYTLTQPLIAKYVYTLTRNVLPAVTTTGSILLSQKCNKVGSQLDLKV